MPAEIKDSAKTGALILAAGFSNRFGSIKLNAPLPSGDTVFQTTLRKIRQVVPDPLIITRDEVFPVIFDGTSDIRIFENAEQGMGATLAFGIGQILEDATRDWDACLICLADMPFIKPATYKSIKRKATAANIVIPRHDNNAGNPIAFGKAFFESLTQLSGDQGGRRLVRSNPDAVTYLETSDPAIFFDIDTPQDLTRFGQ